MKILLTAVNAKFIHSNPAIYSLRAYSGREMSRFIELAEYTINNKAEEILADIYRRKPDVVALSCYIWNREMITALIRELPKVLPSVEIWLGGPEASYDAGNLLKNYQSLRGIMIGEGEETFRELAQFYKAYLADDILNNNIDCDSAAKDIASIQGIAYRAFSHKNDKEDKLVFTPPRKPTDISGLPFLYEDLSLFENRIIYYESSRGCPYRCSYCLSSIDKTVRLRDISIIKKELGFFLDNKVRQVKFVDRTFNCNKEQALNIWEFIAKNDNGVTNFHFEVEAEILTDQQIETLAKMRPGLVQLEIGVQSVNPDTLKEIRRVSDINVIRKNVEKLSKNRNIHIHLDLIAGLPYEDYDSFRNSFNTVYAMNPDELQLGFLKVLKGSYMYEKSADYELKYTDVAPYEVLSTKWLSYGELLKLKRIEEMLELYYNSGQFGSTMPVMQTAFEDAFSMYDELAAFYEDKGYLLVTPSRSYRYQALLDFAMAGELGLDEELIKQLLTFDLYLRENIKSRPDFVKNITKYKRLIRSFYEREEKERVYLPAYKDYDARQLAGMTHMEVFDYPVWEKDIPRRMKRLDVPCMVLFDYKKKSPVTQSVEFIVISDKEFGDILKEAEAAND